MRLITIPISHYCERARWALAHATLPFKEEQHIQVLHWPHALLAGGKKTVPVLVLDDGQVLDDSSDIVRFADVRCPAGRKLYPSGDRQREEVANLEREFTEFGVESRRAMYFHFFNWGRDALRFNAGRAPRWEAFAMLATYPLARGFMRRYLDVSALSERQARAHVDETMDQVGERLKDGRRFLMGDQFTAADLTFACMAAAVISPPYYGVKLPQPAELPASIRALVEGYRAHPAGAFALRLFEDHRRVQATAAPA